MKIRCAYIFPLLCGLLLVASCNSNTKSGNHGPIVLGDSATIVTETDSQNLRDFVTDLQPATPPAAKEEDTATQAATLDTAQKPQEQTAKTTPPPAKEIEAKKEPAVNGLNVAFKEVTVSIPNIGTKSFRNQNPQRANGVTYQLTTGNLNNNQIKITNGSVTTVSQRYETMVVVKNDLGVLPLESLTTNTDWQPLKGRGNVYTISGLAPSALTCDKASPAEIRNAVTRAARRQRMSRSGQRDWLNSIRNVRAVNQRPLTIVLRSVEWKIAGKTANGKSFQKQLRIDIP
jgi:hypothetical protein